jgi:hypothetical protein
MWSTWQDIWVVTVAVRGLSKRREISPKMDRLDMSLIYLLTINQEKRVLVTYRLDLGLLELLICD